MGKIAGQNPQFGAQSSFKVHFFIREVLQRVPSGLLYSVQRFGAELICILQEYGRGFESSLQGLGVKPRLSIPEPGVKLSKQVTNRGPCFVNTFSTGEHLCNTDIKGKGSVLSALSFSVCYLDRNILWF